MNESNKTVTPQSAVSKNRAVFWKRDISSVSENAVKSRREHFQVFLARHRKERERMGMVCVQFELKMVWSSCARLSLSVCVREKENEKEKERGRSKRERETVRKRDRKKKRERERERERERGTRMCRVQIKGGVIELCTPICVYVCVCVCASACVFLCVCVCGSAWGCMRMPLNHLPHHKVTSRAILHVSFRGIHVWNAWCATFRTDRSRAGKVRSKIVLTATANRIWSIM